MPNPTLHIHPNDNVIVALRPMTAGETVGGILLQSDIPLGHKIALKDLKSGDTVLKYGHDIGRVVADTTAGEHVHIHNLKTKRW